VKLTNKYNLPDTIIRGARMMNDRYDRGEVRRSVTQLINPPRIDILRKLHYKDMETDISDNWWSLFGSAVHYILEIGADDNMVVEERFFAEIDGWPVSGMADLQEYHPDGTGSLSDYKTTTAFVVMKNDEKVEWVAQLNMLAYLAHLNGRKINNLKVVCIIRDWQRSTAAADPSYPIAPIITIPIPLWPVSRQKEFMEERVRLHREGEMLMDLGEPLPECTAEERWQKDDKWAVLKKGAKRAARVHDDEETALLDADARGKAYAVEYRPGKSVRCAGNYCQVAPWCDQWARMKQESSDDGEETEQEQT
jgi:hypothetical protein